MKNSLLHMLMLDPAKQQPLFEASPRPIAFTIREDTSEKIVIVPTGVGEYERCDVTVTRDGALRATITGTDDAGPFELRLTGTKTGNRVY
jgi:hypothetical protein